MSINERILELVELKAEGNKSKFASMIGIPPQNISRITKADGPVGLITIEHILSTFPDVNPKWLITGQGPITFIDHELDALIDSKVSLLRRIQADMGRLTVEEREILKTGLKSLTIS